MGEHLQNTPQGSEFSCVSACGWDLEPERMSSRRIVSHHGRKYLGSSFEDTTVPGSKPCEGEQNLVKNWLMSDRYLERYRRREERYHLRDSILSCRNVRADVGFLLAACEPIGGRNQGAAVRWVGCAMAAVRRDHQLGLRPRTM